MVRTWLAEEAVLDILQTISATEFKAKCLDILDRLAAHEVDRVEVTKRGRVVAVLTPPQSKDEAVDAIFGCMAGSVIIHGSVDLTAPILADDFGAEDGFLHR